MTQIKTTVLINYDSIVQKSGYGVIQMNSWREDLSGSFIADTEKFGMIDNVLESIPGSSKTVIINRDKYNFLITQIKPLLPEGLTPFDEREFIKKHALLIYVQNDRLDQAPDKCVWGLLPNQFEVV